MKYISRILVTVGLVCSLAACTDEAFVTTGPELPVKGDMTVNLTFALPDVAAQTRSKVSGTENRVHIMQMVCLINSTEAYYQDFPGGPVAKTLNLQRRGPRFDPWSGN